MASRGLTIPQAIEQLFGINVATESPFLKNKAESMVRNKLIKVTKEKIVQRSAQYLWPGQEITLFNALVLNAIFTDPKDVKKIFKDTKFRRDCAVTIRQLFGERNSALGQTLQKIEAQQLADALEHSTDLHSEKLPNPFKVLPQVALGKNSNLLHALLAQASALEPADSLLMAYLTGDWKKAEQLTNEVKSESPGLCALCDEIKKKIAEAHEFDDLLGFLKNK